MTLSTMILKMSEGLGNTCAIFFLTLLFSLPLGMVFALLRMSKSRIVSSVMRFVISILRGTPLMLQLLAVTYGPYYLFKDTLDGIGVAQNKLIPVVIAFAINYAAYFAEIYRGGIESMPIGQYEAAGVLGYTKAQTFMRIILRVVSRVVLHRQADLQLRDQLHAVPHCRRVLLCVQRHCGCGHGSHRKADGLL